MRKIYFYFFAALLILQPLASNAQVVVINTGTAGTPISSVGPILLTNLGSFKASRYSYLYTQAELAAAGIPVGADVTALGWMKNSATPTTGAASFTIYMKNSSATAFAAASVPWTTQISGATQVYQNLAELVPATMNPNYIDFILNTPFTYTGDALEISVEWNATGVTGNPGTGELLWMWSTVVDRIYGASNTTMAGVVNLSSTTSNTTINDRRPFIQITYSAPLPVTLINFNGVKRGSANRLTWETSAEVNSKGFELERSADGEVFTKLAFVEANNKPGNNEVRSYFFDDLEPIAGINYYRLKQIDQNDKTEYSSIVTVSFNRADELVVAVYPSPVSELLYVRTNAPAVQKATIVISDVMGRVVIQQPVLFNIGEQKTEIPVIGLAMGTYSLRIVSEDGIQTQVQTFIKH